ncbi:MAG: DUF1150 family protein [Hyphomicrobiaceae bacterium]|jgi:hypothetical protein
MNNSQKVKRRRSREATDRLVVSQIELARLGGGQVAYIREMSSSEAKQMFPAIKGLPRGINLFALHAADGTPIAITDTRSAAVEHASDDQLLVATVH